MPRSLRRFTFSHAAWLLAGRGTPGAATAAHRPLGRGTYRLVCPYPATSSWRQVPEPAAAVVWTANHARYSVGSTTRAVDYDGTDGDEYLPRETGQVGYQGVGADTRRQTKAISITTDDERTH